jgi:antitoxin ParD1/3/4
MNVSLTPELEKFVQKKVASGMYQTASEVVRDGLRRLDEENKFREARLKQVRGKIAKGVAELNAGLGIPADEAWDMIRRRSQKRKSA